MAKHIKKILAMSLVVCMFLSVLPMQSLAAEGDGTTESTEMSPEGLETNVTTTVEGTGTPTVTVTITKDTEGTYYDEDGKKIELDRDQTEITVTETDETGKVTGEDVIYTYEETRTDVTETNGYMSSTWYEVDGKETSKDTTPLPEGGVSVDVPLTEGDETSVTFGDEVGTEHVTGDLPEGEDDTEYDYSKTTVEEQGKVTVSNTDVFVEETFQNEDTNMEHVSSDTTPNDTNDLVYAGQAPDEYLPDYEGEPVPPEMPEGYDYVHVGSGNTSKFVPAIVFDRPMTEEDKIAQYGEGAYISSSASYYVGCLPAEMQARVAKDANGKFIKDEEGFVLDIDGNRILKEELTTTGPDGETLYLRRFDKTFAGLKVEGWYEDGEWVEDLNGDKSFTAIWAGPQQFVLVDTEGNVITTYCADFTTPTQDYFGYNMENLEEADYYSEEEAGMIRSVAFNGYWGNAEGAGSLEDMRRKLAESGKFTEEELALLNDGVALTATQMAIWTFSNHMTGIEFVNAHYSSWGPGNVPEGKESQVELLFKIYDHLVNLDPTLTEGTTADTVIDADTFVDDLNVTVIDMANGHENNQDNDDTNDAYVTKVSFSLVVAPSGSDKDDLVAYLLASDGVTVLAQGRIAGDGPEEEFLPVDENGNYYFENITMIEGEQSFQLNLSGVQHLEQGVYLYTSQIDADDTSSQTMVGLANGDRGVDVTMNVTFEMNVEGVTVTERVWHEEGDPTVTWLLPPPPTEDLPPEEPEVPEEPWIPPENHRLGGDTVEIPDEPVPLASPTKTGDDTGLWVMMALMVAFSMVAVNVCDKKRRNASF